MKLSYKILFLAILVCLLYANIQFWHFSLLGWFLILFLLLLMAGGWKSVLVTIFNLGDNTRTKILAVFFSLIVLGWLAGAAIVFYRLTSEIIALIFLAVGAISLFIDYRINKKNNENTAGDGRRIEKHDDAVIQIPQNYFYVVAYLIFFIVGLALLYGAQSGDSVNTPWQVIAHNYIYIFFLATLTVGGLIFSHYRVPILLFLLVLNSFLLHSYLPLSHKMIYGADAWRHLAVEKQVAAEQRFIPQNFSENKTGLIQSISPGRLSYSQFWGTSVILSRALNVDLLKINIWLLPVLWPIIFTLLLFELGLSLGWGRKKALFLVWLSSWPFALQAAGSFTLPVNYGFLIWMLLTLLIIQRIRSKKPGQKYFLAIAGIFSALGYLLFFILFWLGWFMAEILPYWKKIKNTAIKNFSAITLAVASMLVLPVLELAAKFSFWNPFVNCWDSLKQFGGNFIAYYLAGGPRPHLINTGNIFFNQTPAYAFIMNVLTEWRWWLVGIMILVVIGIITGALLRARDKSIAGKWIIIMSFGALGGYIISRYFLSGENILTRRLDAVLALFLLILLFSAISKILDRQHSVVILVILVAAIISASYTLGPVSRAVSEDEYRAMEYVWQREQGNERHCVIADTYPLLALEAISNKKIIGGGFPIDEYFGQAELVSLHSRFSRDLNGRLFIEAKSATGADGCFAVISADIILQKSDLMLQPPPGLVMFGNVAVLEYN